MVHREPQGIANGATIRSQRWIIGMLALVIGFLTGIGVGTERYGTRITRLELKLEALESRIEEMREDILSTQGILQNKLSTIQVQLDKFYIEYRSGGSVSDK